MHLCLHNPLTKTSMYMYMHMCTFFTLAKYIKPDVMWLSTKSRRINIHCFPNQSIHSYTEKDATATYKNTISRPPTTILMCTHRGCALHKI